MNIRRFVGWLWLLSGLPIGLALVVLPPAGRLLFFTAAVFLETGHSLSPIIMAWTAEGSGQSCSASQKSSGYCLWWCSDRRLPSARLRALDGRHSSLSPYHDRQITDLSNPFPILVWVYLIWNGYHFGMQNFGVLSLYRDKPVVPDGVRLI
jgi:hypothetical protein